MSGISISNYHDALREILQRMQPNNDSLASRHLNGCGCSSCCQAQTVTNSNHNGADQSPHTTTDSLVTNITQAASSGSGYFVQALLKGFNWTGNVGQASTITYSINTAFFSDNSSALNGSQNQAAKQALQAWANVANIHFAETGGNANLALRQADLPSGTAGVTMTSYSGSRIINSEINIDVAQNGFSPGGSAYFTFLHEIGHAIGLKHSGNYNPNDSGPTLTAGEDNWDASVMSYYPGARANTANLPSTPMIYDIAAAQYLYGANQSYNAGNSVYNVTGARVAAAIWDGNGNDTINAAGSRSGGVIDLREGLANVTSIGATSLWMAFGANIENAIGSNANDTLYGNSLSNQLFGNSGNDTLIGYSGNDFLQGNMGNDTLDGSDGNDTIFGGKDHDLLTGGTGDDIMNGNMGNDIVIGNEGNDIISGGQNEDILYGNEGNDILSGDLGNDTLIGGAGSDIFVFNLFNGRDVIQDFELPGAALGDRIQIHHQIFSSAQEALSAVSYSGGNAIINLGGGNTITLVGIAGGLSPEDFIIA